MKKSFIIFISILLSSITYTNAATPDGPEKTKRAPASTESTDPHIVALVNRYNTIETMNTKDLSASEKKALRKESSDLKAEMQQTDSVVFVISGTVLVLILLLIILL